MATPATPESGSLSFDVQITAGVDAATLAADAAFVGMMADAGAKILLGSSADRSSATINVALDDASVRRLSVQEGSSYAITASYTATLSSAQMQQLATTRATDGAAASSLFNAALANSTYTIIPDEASFTAALASVNTQTTEFLTDAGLSPTVATPALTQGSNVTNASASSAYASDANASDANASGANASDATSGSPGGTDGEEEDSGAHSSATLAVFAMGAVVAASLALI